MAKKVWKSKLAFKAYDLALTGLKSKSIAAALGVTPTRFSQWKRMHPILRYALKRARKRVKDSKGKTLSFKDYVFQRLPDKLQALWDEIMELDEADSGQAAIEALLKKNGTRARQNIFVHAMTSSNFSLSQALHKANMSKALLDYWIKTEPEFALLLEELNWHKKNFFEDKLSQLIDGGDPMCTVFANRTYNKDRGYGETKMQHLHVTGEVQSTTVLKLDELDLPPEITSMILDQIMHRKKIVSTVVKEETKALVG
jgi:hypothetical protein